ncbi:MAG: transposase [Desulfobacterales bacterium]|nr:transposase [Desulfobacterales bacterium]
MPRQARLDAPGTLHHVIVRGIEKRRIVDDSKDRGNFVSRMGKIAGDTGTIIYAWALLANHAHLLLRSSEFGLSRYMRRLLTGYALSYNKRHRRHGHLFQNRYRSVICEEEPYFLELVRYIHLNPLRAGLVEGLAGLDRYRWCGHAVLLGRYANEWQDCGSVLTRFGQPGKSARAAYRQYIAQGVEQGRRPELVGGGLIRSLGGWSAVKALRRLGIRAPADERILGSGGFVERVIKESAGQVRRQSPGLAGEELINRVVCEFCDQEEINIKELRSGSRRRPVAQARKRLMQILVEEQGVTLAETARQLGVSTSAISKSLMRKAERKSC